MTVISLAVNIEYILSGQKQTKKKQHPDIYLKLSKNLNS